MECNKDEAVRAKLIAERKLAEKDFSGAKKFVLKAQTLYPGLEGLHQMLTTLEVYIAAENKISGEVDWYGILGVNPYADDETVKKQYRKLALILHPDKNKSVGGEGAFKLLSEAWSLISDKAKRLAYNQRRSSRGFQPKVPTKGGGQSAPTHPNGFPNFPTSAPSNVRTQNNPARMQNNTARVRPTSVRPPPKPRTDTFWTICHRCKMHYEYLRVYLNHTLLCPNCQQAFLASETAPPLNFPKPPSTSSSHQTYQNPGHHATNGSPSAPGRYAGAAQNSKPGVSAGLNSFNHSKVQQGQFTRTTISSPSVAAKAANVVQQANEKLKREREETQAAGGWERLFRNRGLDDDGKGYGGNPACQMAMGKDGTGMGSSFGLRNGGLHTGSFYVYGFSGNSGKPNGTRELTPLETRNMLMAKARNEISKKLNDLSSAAKSADSKKEKVKSSKLEKEKNSVKGDTRELNGNGMSCGTMGGDQAKEDLAAASITVPDPDFHDFDQDRTESSFGDNQVWAAYDNDDGMPRFYAMIHKVLSLNPFKMRISWLNSKTNSEFSTIDWVGSGFFKTCGEFRVGKYELTKSLNSFSHKVNWTKGPRGTVCIVPKKGDVWALYRNWAPDWSEHTADEVIHKYEMVEVLDDYNEDQGVPVAPLIKVVGFKTVFHRDTNLDKMRRIPKEEMFRFSHQVPSYLLTGQEAQNSPKGCLELDPAAAPLELLQVITEADEVKIEENDGKAEKGNVINTVEVKEEPMVENGEATGR